MPSAADLRNAADQPIDPNTPQTYEIRERQQQEQPEHSANRPRDKLNAPTNEDYTPDPSRSLKLEPERQQILDSIVRLYNGSARHEDGATGEQDMRVYAHQAVYDDVWSYCDTRFKIAGQWYGIPFVMKSSTTPAVEVVSSTPIPAADGGAKEPGAIVFKMKHAWTPRLLGKTFDVHHFVTLSLEKARDEDGPGPGERIKYHKDQWNEKDYSHAGLGKVMKTLNGDFATIGTRPPKDL